VADRKKDELQFYKEWQHSGNKEPFQKLYKSMKNLLHSAAKKAAMGSNIPESAHKAWAAQNFYDALRTFNPNAGAALQTHVYNSVHQKAKRLNYMYQNLAHMPEPRTMIVGQYQNAYEYLRASHDREPSTQEISDHMGVGISDVALIQKEIRKDLAFGEGTEEQAFFEGSRDEEILSYLYYDLSTEEQNLYEYLFGKNGKPRLVKPNGKIDFDKIALAMGMSVSKVRAILSKIRVKLKQALKK